MANSTPNGSNTATLELFCRTGLEINQKVFLLSVNIALSITAFMGNVLIIAALRKVSSLHSPSKVLLGCLACTDLCVGLITQPLYVTYLLTPEHSTGCFYVQMIFYITATQFGGASLLTLTAISVDRLLALMLGLRYRQAVTLKRVRSLVVVVWLLSIAVAMTYIRHFHFAIHIICTVMLQSIVTSTFCYMKIYHALHQHQTQVHVHQDQASGGASPLSMARYRKTVSSALWVHMVFLVCYVPYLVVVICYLAGIRYTAVPFVWQVALSLVLLNSSLNPCLYCWKIKDVREAVKDIIRQCCWFSVVYPYPNMTLATRSI